MSYAEVRGYEPAVLTKHWADEAVLPCQPGRPYSYTKLKTVIPIAERNSDFES